MPDLGQLRLLLLSLGAVFALHAPWQAPWVLAAVALAGLWRHHLAVRKARLPGLRLLLPLLLLCLLGVLLSYGRLMGRDAGIALFSLLLALKLLEAKSSRDLSVLAHLGYFLTICTFLFSQSIIIAVLTIMPVTLLTATLITINHAPVAAARHPPWSTTLRAAAGLLALALPLLLALFVLFPRAPGPLWKPPQDMGRALTGLDDTMTPGKISALTRSYAVAFRVDFKGQRPPPLSRLYWRGPVLTEYDGRTWRAGRAAFNRPPPARQALSAPLPYSLTLEPHNRCWLYLLELPASQPGTGTVLSAFSGDLQLLARDPVLQRIRYEADASLDYRLGQSLSAEQRAAALQLPPAGDPRTRRLAQQWREQDPDPQAIMQKALTLFSAKFSYTLLAPPLGDNPNDALLFVTHQGFCEHFASSFVFLMRAAGVPARVVTGYQGGEFNPLGNYLLVRQSDAHAWAEIWLENRGWLRVDPTAAVAPARVESGIAQALAASEPLPALVRTELNAPKRFSLAWDALNNRYNQWILGYNQKRQSELLATLTGSWMTRGDLALWLVGLLIALFGAIAWLMLRPKHKKTDAVQAAWHGFVKKLHKAGIKHLPSQGPRHFAEAAANALPERRVAILDILQRYLALRYGDQHSASAVRELQIRIQQFKPK